MVEVVSMTLMFLMNFVVYSTKNTDQMRPKHETVRRILSTKSAVLVFHSFSITILPRHRQGRHSSARILPSM